MKLFYIPRFTAGAVVVLQQQVIIDSAQKASALGADIIALELLFQSFLFVNGPVGRLPIETVSHDEQRYHGKGNRVRPDGLAQRNQQTAQHRQEDGNPRQQVVHLLPLLDGDSSLAVILPHLFERFDVNQIGLHLFQDFLQREVKAALSQLDFVVLGDSLALDLDAVNPSDIGRLDVPDDKCVVIDCRELAMLPAHITGHTCRFTKERHLRIIHDLEFGGSAISANNEFHQSKF